MSQPVAPNTSTVAPTTTTAATPAQHPSYEDQAKNKTSRITTNLQGQAQHLKERLAGPEKTAMAGTGTTRGAEHDPAVNQTNHGFMAKAKQGMADTITYTQQGLEGAKNKFNGASGTTSTTAPGTAATSVPGTATTGAAGTAAPTTAATAAHPTSAGTTGTSHTTSSTTTTSSHTTSGTGATGGGFPAPTQL
ncbi:hypothetical protein WJX74_008702 [Apatococcus lobatus]|uniref:Uncharacterized protein n=1 Tax=Apatococcus lobatus TaxID=904363 RepID=A0AAW1RHK4_9CHLO